MAKRKKHWSEIIEAHGIKVRVYERAGTDQLWASRVTGGKKKRTSLGTADREVAKTRAKAIAKELAEVRLTGRAPDTLTLRELRTLYLHHKRLSEARKMYATTSLDLVVRSAGEGFVVGDFGQDEADTYIADRRAGRLKPTSGNNVSDSPSDATIRNELLVFTAACNWAVAKKVSGRRLLERSPMKDVRLPKVTQADRVDHALSADEYAGLLEVADKVDAAGRLRCLSVLAWETGRRINALVHLRASDVLSGEGAVADALKAEGKDPRVLDGCEYAIRWRAEWDKRGYGGVAPVSKAAHDAVAAFLRANPRVGEAWLFSAPTDPAGPLSKHTAGRWFTDAWKAADIGSRPHRAGWHSFRRAWATRRKHLAPADVAAVGGWRDIATLMEVYQKADAAAMRRVADLDAG